MPKPVERMMIMMVKTTTSWSHNHTTTPTHSAIGYTCCTRLKLRAARLCVERGCPPVQIVSAVQDTQPQRRRRLSRSGLPFTILLRLDQPYHSNTSPLPFPTHNHTARQRSDARGPARAAPLVSQRLRHQQSHRAVAASSSPLPFF